MKIKKAIFPLAGVGSRMFPITKSIPKEMLPIFNKPILHYAVEEVVASGITNLVFVVRNQKEILQKYLSSEKISTKLVKKNRYMSELESLISRIDSIKYVKQEIPIGMGDAIWRTKKTIDNEPFMIILADNIFKTKDVSITSRLIQHFQKYNSSIISLSKVEPQNINKYGIVKINPVNKKGLFIITNLTEKPLPGTEPSNTAVTGRYIFTPDIFPILSKIKKKNRNGEVPFSIAISKLAMEKNVFGYKHEKSSWFDCGTPSGLQKANIAFSHKT